VFLVCYSLHCVTRLGGKEFHDFLFCAFSNIFFFFFYTFVFTIWVFNNRKLMLLFYYFFCKYPIIIILAKWNTCTLSQFIVFICTSQRHTPLILLACSNLSTHCEPVMFRFGIKINCVDLYEMSERGKPCGRSHRGEDVPGCNQNIAIFSSITVFM